NARARRTVFEPIFSGLLRARAFLRGLNICTNVSCFDLGISALSSWVLTVMGYFQAHPSERSSVLYAPGPKGEYPQLKATMIAHSRSANTRREPESHPSAVARRFHHQRALGVAV